MTTPTRSASRAPAILFCLLTLINLFTLVSLVNLTPQVDRNFFFSNEDSQFQTENEISSRFKRQDDQVILSATGDISSDAYWQKIDGLSHSLLRSENVISVKSITHGPKDLKDALESPLWKRLLISTDQKSTNLLVFVAYQDDYSQSIRDIEEAVDIFEGPDFFINISGMPYVVELIKRSLTRDLWVFSSLAFLIFALVILLIFRSRVIFIGTMVTCLNAAVITFMLIGFFKIPVGILTANLATIVFVLTLSHIVFLTSNWKTASVAHVPNPVRTGLRMTLTASFWSMVTTSLGFLSLFSVSAKPLRELGIAGTIGTVVAFVVVYTIYPAFLRLTQYQPQRTSKLATTKLQILIEKYLSSIRFALFVLLLAALPGLRMLNSDPSLLSFFSDNGEIYQGLEYIDKNGGSSPMILVVEQKSGEPLVSQAAYEKLWDLQEHLEGHRSVGSVISLPVLMAQARQEPLAKLLAWDWILNILDKPQYDRIASSFVSEDRKQGLFMMRMNELYRVQTRLEIVEELNATVQTHGFVPKIVGGIYVLQGHLSKLVVASIVSGLWHLVVVFTVIALIVSWSLAVGFALTAAIIFIPFIVLGFIGLYRIPLDIISAPASNIAIGIGIDAMIHMVKAYHRRKDKNEAEAERWLEVVHEMRHPVLNSMLVIVTGFAIFFFSSFPPTQRFGLAIVFGSIIAGLTALTIMPWAAQRLAHLSNHR